MRLDGHDGEGALLSKSLHSFVVFKEGGKALDYDV